VPAAARELGGNGYHFEYSYDEDLRQYNAQVRDTGGRVTEMWYNEDGYLVRVDVDGRTEKQVQKEGRDTAVVHPDGGVTAKAYDIFDNVTRITHPDGGTELFRYDLALHKKTRHTNPNGGKFGDVVDY